MESKEFDSIKYIKHWIDSSDEDFETMNTMFETKQYAWSMFIGHLMIEKLLKARMKRFHPLFIICQDWQKNVISF